MTALDTASTATAAPSRRRARVVWVLLAVGLVIVATGGLLLAGAGQWTGRDVLDPESAGPQGARALAQVLRGQGVEVVVVRDRAAARTALGRGEATLVLPDSPLLSDDGLRAVTDAATDVVLIDPRARGLRVLLPGSRPAGVAAAALDPGCDLPEARRAGAVTVGALYAPGAEASGCYPSGDGFGLLWAPGVAAVDGRAAFTDEHLAAAGNAALGVGLLGRHPLVVWYVPSLGDSDLPAADPTLGELTPGWVTPAIALLALAGVLAAVWRGRRFGPLVSEPLPVTVRGAETTEGRAHLYERAHDTVHAADQLRRGALERIAKTLSLARTASPAEIADAAAARVVADRGVVHGILIDDFPRNDAELVALSDRLRDLETAVRRAARPERNRP